MTAWTSAALAARIVPDHSIEAFWRTLNYLSTAQLYLTDNILGARPFRASDIKAEPRGHWGVCPPVNWLLAHLGPISAHRPPNSELVVLHGAGHAGPAALAHAYLTQELTLRNPSWSTEALHELITEFPHADRFGGEITPLIGNARHTGGQLGPALAIGQGMVLDAPNRLAVVLIGDGECETGATAAAWLASRALNRTGEHGSVLPVVLLNGLRMGGPSLLSSMAEAELRRYFTGLGYAPHIHDGANTTTFRDLLTTALAELLPLGSPGLQPVIVLTMPKGFTGPSSALGTAAVHKTPLKDPRTNARELEELQTWLVSYRPAELLTPSGSPTPLVRAALPQGSGRAEQRINAALEHEGRTVAEVIQQRAARGSFRLFSPDELASNRIHLGDETPPWVVEILNEEICHSWLQGYTETGRDALLATYEAFAPINTSLLAQHLKHRRLRRPDQPSINYLITSLSWNNTYTHQNPGLVSAILELQDPAAHVYTPADSARAAAALAAMLTSRDQANFLIAGKYPTRLHPTEQIAEELTHGITEWPHLSSTGQPDLVLASAGDLPTRELSVAAEILRTQGTKVRYLNIHDLTVLGPAEIWPMGLARDRFLQLFGAEHPVLLATVCFPNPVRALLADRADADRFHVVGFRDPGRPLSPEQLLQHTGMRADLLAEQAHKLLKEAQ